MSMERTDKLRRRPDNVRYFYLALSRTTIHTGMSYGGLNYVLTRHGVAAMYVADLVTGEVTKVEEPVEDFMSRWRAHYNDPEWCYSRDIAEGMPVPKA